MGQAQPAIESCGHIRYSRSMTFSVSRYCGVALLFAGLILAGCLPAPQSQSDEEKEPHFLEGRSRVNTMDYPGAIESFEKALDANPQSASAHFELGWLFDRKEPDAAAAIYHYAKYLTLRPGADNGENVKERIVACKQELARAVSLGPITEKQQRDLEKLADENRQLTEQNKQMTEELAKWRAYYTGRPIPQTNSPPHTSVSSRSLPSALLAQPAPADGTSSNGAALGRSGQTASPARTHVIKSGETLTMVARKYGVKMDALMSANSRVDPRRLRPGQTLNIP